MQEFVDTLDPQEAIELLKRMATFAGPTGSGGQATVIRPTSGASEGDGPNRGHVWKPDLRYRSLVEKLPVVTFMASLDDVMQELYVSPQIETLLGFTQAEWLDNPILWYRQLHPDDRDAWVAGFAETCATGAHFRSEYRLIAHDGRIVWVQGECQVIRDEEGKPLFLQGIAFDITHIKRAAQDEEAKLAAESANRAKSEFLARMSHEIRTPLNGVVGMIDLLRSTGLNANQDRYVQLARESADALLRVINDILDFSKIEAGKVEIENIEFDLHRLVEDLAEVLAPVAAKKNLALASILRPEVPRNVIGDPNRIRQVLTNLINNALKFTARGYVSIRASVDRIEGDSVFVRIGVDDTGIGIPPDRIDRLFKSFSQVDTSTTRKYGGTGLGLVISKQLVELMGGEVGIESQVGRGTTFWFTLKLGAAAQDETAPEAAGPAELLRAVRVLAIEPDPIYRKILADQWETRLAPSSTIVDAPKALDVLRTGFADGKPFSVVLLPYGTPEGASLLTEIRSDSKFQSVKLVAVTDPDKHDEETIQKAGYFATIRRPILQSRLMDVIASATVKRTPAAPAKNSPISSQHSLAGVHLLVAEDNDMNQFVVQETLRRVGCTCDIAGDGSLAVDAVKNIRYDAVLMDCQMPVMDGLEATRTIRKWEAATPGSRHIPIIALTAEAIDGDREKCLAAGMDNYVTKPIKPDDLYAAIRSLVPAKVDAAVNPAAPAPPAPPAPIAAATPAATDPVKPIDLASLIARCMGDTEFACSTLEKFKHRALEDVELLRRGVSDGDAEGARRLAHNLKAVAAHVAAESLRKIAFEIEQAGIRRDLGFMETQLTLLADEARRCAAYVPEAILQIARQPGPVGSAQTKK